jgi:hypothetical protein
VPIDQGKFNLRISVAQLIAAVVLSPILLSISYNYDNYADNSKLDQLQKNNAPFFEFFTTYMSLGF